MQSLELAATSQGMLSALDANSVRIQLQGTNHTCCDATLSTGVTSCINGAEAASCPFSNHSACIYCFQQLPPIAPQSANTGASYLQRTEHTRNVLSTPAAMLR